MDFDNSDLPKKPTPFTTNLTEEELACRDGTPYPFDRLDEDTNDGRTWRETRATPLGQLFEAIRAAAGDYPISVDSAYRTLAYDRALYEADKGAGNVATPQGSQHPKGRALDLKHTKLSALSFFALILRLYDKGETPICNLLGGIGLYPTFVHVDVRPKPIINDKPHLAIWGGSRPTNVA